MKTDLKVAYDPEKKGMEVLLKYNVNTLWGLIASVYFPINNVLVAEQITSNIRLYVYMMSRTLNCFQTITDGGAYCLNEVCYLKKSPNFKKPGLAVLSSFQLRKNHRSIEIKSFKNINWDSVFENNNSYKSEHFQNLDFEIKQHIVNFWAVYNISFEVDVEHKVERFSKKIAYMYKAHYMMLIFDEKTQSYSKKIAVIRGFRYNPQIVHLNPMYKLLETILDSEDGEDIFFKVENNSVYEERSLLKLGSWVRYLKHKQITFQNTDDLLKKDILLPGDEIFSPKLFRFHNLHTPTNTYKEFQRKNRRSMRVKGSIFTDLREIKLRQPLFEKYFEKNMDLKTILNKMLEDKI